MKFTQALRKFHQEESGQDLVEYLLVAVAVLTAAVAGSNSLSGTLTAGVATLNAALQNVFNG
jgi:Flp pilus assembly pilin Flp